MKRFLILGIIPLFAFSNGIKLSKDKIHQGDLIKAYLPYDGDTDSLLLTTIYHLEDTSIVNVKWLYKKDLKNNYWIINWKIPNDCILFQYRLEKISEDKTENIGKNEFYTELIYNNQNKPVKNSYFFWAYVISKENKDSLFNSMKALLNEELQNYPNNWRALFSLWQIELSTDTTKKAELLFKVDSLVSLKYQEKEVLFGACEMYLGILNWPERARDILKKLAKDFPDSKAWMRLRFYLRDYTKDPSNYTFFKDSIFPFFDKEIKLQYYDIILRHIFSKQPDLETIDNIINDLNTNYKNTRLLGLLILTRMKITYSYRDDNWAKELVEWFNKTKKRNPDIAMALASYYTDKDWKTANRYYKLSIKDSNPEYINTYVYVASEKNKLNKELINLSRKLIYNLYTFDKFTQQNWYIPLKERLSEWSKHASMYYDTYAWALYKTKKYKLALDIIKKTDSILLISYEYNDEVFSHMKEIAKANNDQETELYAMVNMLPGVKGHEDITLKDSIRTLFHKLYGENEDFNKWIKSKGYEILIRYRRNENAYDFTVYDINNPSQAITLKSLRGKVVVLNFWATWCGPCKKEISHISENPKKFQDKPVVFIAITNEAPDIVKPFLKNLKDNNNEFTYSIYWDKNGTASKGYDIKAIPTHIIIDKNGVMQFKHIGYIPGIEEIISKEVESLLK